jgi:outer membrane lipoprotein-sorting protein
MSKIILAALSILVIIALVSSIFANERASKLEAEINTIKSNEAKVAQVLYAHNNAIGQLSNMTSNQQNINSQQKDLNTDIVNWIMQQSGNKKK